ncbi:hypothetical protein [Sphaerochaeta sp. PS]|uniref:hypothetical protein n=1 Tax=Sphaerochaeta sp. PS TaxID=3076336 RepID=UPI0028A47DB4|nr:hypothetical protein [Sphaerochaeta sp. PS]MDT4762684.1 hypothetical protein [Sphaerochaeta sp. PS]
MRNIGTILISLGVLLIGFALLTPLLFFLIALLLGKASDASLLLGMQYALLSSAGVALVFVGSLLTSSVTLLLGFSFFFSALSLVGSLVAPLLNGTRDLFFQIAQMLFFASQLVALCCGIALLHRNEK